MLAFGSEGEPSTVQGPISVQNPNSFKCHYPISGPRSKLQVVKKMVVEGIGKESAAKRGGNSREEV